MYITKEIAGAGLETMTPDAVRPAHYIHSCFFIDRATLVLLILST